jgi:putative colanic acid biosynthesis acetyltransferase WcaB
MYLLQDWKANKGNIKGRIIMIAFRIAAWVRRLPTPLWYLGIPVLILYRIIVEWFLCIELPFKTTVGKGLIIQHGQALVVNDRAVIGKNCVLRNGCTIGIKKDVFGNKSKAPVLGNNVDLGANVVIIGPVEIGDNVIIGAGSVIVKNVQSHCVIAGNPARVIKQLN